MRIPQGFIDISLEDVKLEAYAHILKGEHMDTDYYVAIAAARLWYCYLNWKNTDSHLDTYLTLRDITAACHKVGIPYKEVCDIIYISMPGRDFMFTDSIYNDSVYGGPCDRNADYQGHCIWGCPMAITTKTFFKLLETVDSVVDLLRAPVSEYVDEIYLQQRISEIEETTMEPLLKEGMEDLSYTFRIKPERKNESIEIWLYYDEYDNVPEEFKDRCVYFDLELKDFMERMDLFKRILHIVAKDIRKWKNYSHAFKVKIVKKN